MEEVIYEKNYPKESPEEFEKLLRELDSEEIEVHKIPTANEFFKQLEEEYTYVSLPSRQKEAETFIRTAREVSELYSLDVKIIKHVSHIAVNYYFTAAAGMRYLLDVIRRRTTSLFSLTSGDMKSPCAWTTIHTRSYARGASCIRDTWP